MESKPLSAQLEDIMREFGWINELPSSSAEVFEDEMDRFVSRVNGFISEIHDGGHGSAVKLGFEPYDENHVRAMAAGVLAMLMHASQRNYLRQVGSAILRKLEK